MFTNNVNYIANRYKAIIDTMVDGYAYHKIIFDDNETPIDYKYVEVNESFAQLTGLKSDEIIDKKASELFPDEGNFNLNWTLWGIRAALHGEALKFDTFFAPLNKWFSCSIFSYEYGYFVGVFHDITHVMESTLVKELKKEIENNLVLLQETKMYESLRTDFFANISHELRTPINVLLGSLQLTELYLEKEFDSSGKEKFKKYLKTMRQNCFRLLKLVNNLIDITKIDAGYFELYLEDRNIVKIVEDITMSVAEYMQNKSINLIFDTEIEERIMAVDEDMIERIMLNLLSNSIKFTEAEGTIFVNLYENNDNFVISVRDTGIGIPKDKLNNIFQRFIQVDKSLARCREGSGIGLSLVRSLVEMHNGRISVNSEYGSGTEFIIELPIKLNESNEPSVSQDITIGHAHVDRINIEFSDIYS